MHIARVSKRRAVETAEGIFAALGAGDLPRAFLDAVALHEDEVDELTWRVNADRREAAIRAKLGFGEK